jgi:pimeloyl-ACP methyl ester carboxylesterase
LGTFTLETCEFSTRFRTHPADSCVLCGQLCLARCGIDGVTLQYLIAGKGPPVILLHGYTQTSRMWRPIIASLSEKFTVLARDLPGIGDSSVPEAGLDMKTAAVRIHALARSLGFEKAKVVGHDIGLMVAYAYAAQFPAEVEKLALMDAFLPDVGDWVTYYDNPRNWHFRFNGPTPEALG